jgi:hypothetical protein
MATSPLNAPDYPRFVADLKARIQAARISAARSVNCDLILLYWDIGRGIVEKQQNAGWGDAVVERLAADLRAAFPDLRGLSVANLWRMKQIYLAHTSPEFLAQVVRELKTTGGQLMEQGVPEIALPDALRAPAVRGAIFKQPAQELASTPAFGKNPEFLAQAVRELVASVPWGHHVFMLGKLTVPAARLYYLRATARFGWSRNVLLNQIKAGAYERSLKEGKAHNFPPPSRSTSPNRPRKPSKAATISNSSALAARSKSANWKTASPSACATSSSNSATASASSAASTGSPSGAKNTSSTSSSTIASSRRSLPSI